MGFLFVLIVGLLAGTISGIVGTGSSIMLMPVLVYQYGPKEAVPIMAVAAVMANFSRILAWWREVDWRACLAYSATGIPAAALGARTLLALPSHAVDIAIGLFLIAMVPVRHWLDRHQIKAQLWHLAIGGAIIGYITGIVVSTGPLSVPLFLFYGLTKGAFLATEAASSLGLYLSKSVTFERFGALTPDIALKGLIAGSSLMFGAFIVKRFVLHLQPDVFRLLMDAIMLMAGLSLLWTAATSWVEVQKLQQNAEREKVQAQITVTQATAIEARAKALGTNPNLVTLVQVIGNNRIRSTA
ncbi:sulfite exporter TauE/SafE family protein [Bradyrhizobium sp. 200]|nr:sulfite exporter TauE/SafE family protein [Bradyrhizobium sp. 200]